MSYEAQNFGHEIHLYAASLDNSENHKPTFHVFTSEQLFWLHIADDLPRLTV